VLDARLKGKAAPLERLDDRRAVGVAHIARSMVWGRHPYTLPKVSALYCRSPRQLGARSRTSTISTNTAIDELALYPFNSFFSSLRNRQSVPSARIFCGLVLIMPASCMRSA
jgi:hypothetical protein